MVLDVPVWESPSIQGGASTIPAPGGILYIYETPERSCGLENAIRVSIDIAVGGEKWVKNSNLDEPTL